MEKEPDFYRTLGVPRDAPDREIKRAYYDLARKLHPDKAKSPEEAAKNASDLASISRAYNTLKDPRRREEYDNQTKGRSASPSAAPPPAPSGGSIPRPGTAPPPPAGGAAGGPPQADPPTGDASGPSHQAMLNQRRALAQKAFVKGMQLYKRQELKPALGFFEAAVTNDPESEPQYHLKFAQCLMKARGSFTRAVEHAERACLMDPYNVEFKLALAEINEMAGVQSRAKELYEEVLRWDADNQVAKMRMGLLMAEERSKKGILSKLLPSLMSKAKKKA